MNLRSLAEKPLVTVTPSMSVRDAVKIMAEANVGSVLVVDEQGKLVGIFTERDLVRIIAQGVDVGIAIEKVMTKNPIVVTFDDGLASAMYKMVEHGIRHIPVVDNTGKPVGILSIRDLLRMYIASCSPP